MDILTTRTTSEGAKRAYGYLRRRNILTDTRRDGGRTLVKVYVPGTMTSDEVRAVLKTALGGCTYSPIIQGVA